MSHEQPRIRKSHRHVWLLPDDIAGDAFMSPSSPPFAWARFGPRGSECGAESTAAAAEERSYAAMVMLGPEASQ